MWVDVASSAMLEHNCVAFGASRNVPDRGSCFHGWLSRDNKFVVRRGVLLGVTGMVVV